MRNKFPSGILTFHLDWAISRKMSPKSGNVLLLQNRILIVSKILLTSPCHFFSSKKYHKNNNELHQRKMPGEFMSQTVLRDHLQKGQHQNIQRFTVIILTVPGNVSVFQSEHLVK